MGTDDLTPIQQVALEIVKEITDSKAGMIPRMAHMTEMRRVANEKILAALRELYRMRLVSVSLDINKNPMFAINDP